MQFFKIYLLIVSFDTTTCLLHDYFLTYCLLLKYFFRLKNLATEAFSQEEAERAAGMGSYVPAKKLKVETQNLPSEMDVANPPEQRRINNCMPSFLAVLFLKSPSQHWCLFFSLIVTNLFKVIQHDHVWRNHVIGNMFERGAGQ